VTVRALGELIAAGFRRHATYRLAMFAGAFTNSIFGLLRASIMTAAIGAAGGTLGGYTVASGLTYVWVTQALLGPINLFGWMELADRVRTGDVAIDFTRPIDLQVQLWATDLGRAAAVMIPRGLPPLVVGALTFGLALPTSPWAYLAGIVSIVLATTISFTCLFTLNVIAFWTTDIRGLLTLYIMTSHVLSGLYVPVHWFPAWLGTLAQLTPFPSLVQVPSDILTGRITGPAAGAALGWQALWVLITLGGSRLLLARATHRLVVQGG
jgi:ABC-2 type transport system permease protein